MKNISAVLLCVLTTVCSCGPRSGIHNDEKTTEVSEVFEDTSGEYRTALIKAKSEERGEKLFKQNCAVCHMAGTDFYISGPGLKGIFYRVPQPADEWIFKYTLNNVEVLNSGDSYAKKLKAENKNMKMTIFEGQLTEQDIKDIIQYLKQADKPVAMILTRNTICL